MQIVNLTQHPATPEQLASGVFDLDSESRKELTALLTFEEIPTRAEIHDRADTLARIARFSGADKAMIGGALWLMSALESHLKMNFVQPVYAFSKRESVETTGADGTVIKTNVFKHIGFVSTCPEFVTVT